MSSERSANHILLTFTASCLLSCLPAIAEKESVSSQNKTAVGLEKKIGQHNSQQAPSPASSQNVKRSGRNSEDAGKTISTENAKGKEQKTVASHKSSRQSTGFIPPPPPTVPMAGDLTGMTGMPVDFMSVPDLKRRQKDLNQELSESKSELESKEKTADDKRQRSTLFASLYTEGVVSRRELEASQHEDAEAQVDLKTSHRRLADIEHELTEIEARLKRLAKAAGSKASKTSAKKAENSKSKK